MGESFEAHAWKLAYQWRWAALCFAVWCKWKHRSDRQEDSCFQQRYFCSRVSFFFFNIINIKTIYPVPPPRFTTNKAISMNEKPMLCPKLHTWHTSSQQIVLWGSNFYAIASSQETHCIFFFTQEATLVLKLRLLWHLQTWWVQCGHYMTHKPKAQHNTNRLDSSL